MPMEQFQIMGLAISGKIYEFPEKPLISIDITDK
jgi:hypothetical protein